MKLILICLFLGLSLSYDRMAAVNYAHKYCNKYNPNYNNYRTDKPGDEAAYFISQCLSIGGGQDLSGCEGLDDKGMINGNYALKLCLKSKGWIKNGLIAPGYIMFLFHTSYPLIVTKVNFRDIYYASHNPDRCDGKTYYFAGEMFAPPGKPF